ncbi:MAG: EPSP synthase family protein [Candidatus Xenolissoclinum pacificiensis L6]|uniref:EPSP synthase family protein n=1 Tax=Candidatus Xenolissoclinum pacificiensis L6 TaxID=1401685 RepID=W2UZQ4_9RICK|nr:MAG: EPSP synthase family protein [Candidatus Xenolissoclinum pacificiensis L6]
MPSNIVLVKNIRHRTINTIVNVKSDASVSYRVLIIASLINGNLIINNLSECNNVLAMVSALKNIGVSITRVGVTNNYKIQGMSIERIIRRPRRNTINIGCSITAAHILSSVMSALPINSYFSSDNNICGRSLVNIMSILSLANVRFSDTTLPFAILNKNNTQLQPIIDYHLELSSSRIKTSLLLYAINQEGTSTILEKGTFSRDHMEILLQYLNASITIENTEGYIRTKIIGKKPFDNPEILNIPNDPSLAMLFVIIAAFLKNSCLSAQNICLNQHRIKAMKILQKMHIDIAIEIDKNPHNHEETGVMICKSSNIIPTTIEDHEIKEVVIEDYPLIILICSLADGMTTIHNAGNIINSKTAITMIKELNKLNIITEIDTKNSIIRITGKGSVIDTNGAPISLNAHHEYRLSICFFILSLLSTTEIRIEHAKNDAQEYLKQIIMMCDNNI